MVERFTIGSKWPKHADTPVVFASAYEALVKERDALKASLDVATRAHSFATTDLAREHAKNVALAADKAELLAVLAELEPYLDQLICYGSTIKEYKPNRVIHELRALLARHAAPAKGEV